MCGGQEPTSKLIKLVSNEKWGAYLGSFERIVSREMDIKEKDTSRVGRACTGELTTRSLESFQTNGSIKGGDVNDIQPCT